MKTLSSRIGSFARTALALLLTLSCLQAATVATAEQAYAADGTVTFVGERQSVTEYGYTQNSCYMEINGQFAVCCQHFRETPPQGTPATIIEPVVSNDLMRKVLWYGYGGPGSLGTLSLVHTACALSNANGVDTTLTGRDALAVVADLPSPPSSFVLTKWSTGWTQDLVTWVYNPFGGISLAKHSADASFTDGNDCYSLGGAEFKVYRNSACTDYWFTMTTDADGHWRTDMDIPVGDYWIKESKAPKGYALSEDVYHVQVKAEEYASVDAYDSPTDDPSYLLLGKHDGERTYNGEANLPQGAANLAGARFECKFYGGQFSTAKAAEASGKLLRTWLVETDADGFAMLADEYLAEGSDPLWHDKDTGDPTLPLGTLTIAEKRPPDGYLDTAAEWAASQGEQYPYVRNITSSVSGEIHVSTYNAPAVADKVIRGGVSIEKLDLESLLNSELGAGRFDGIAYEIRTLNDNTVTVEGNDYAKGQVVKTITVKDGKASTDADGDGRDETLPFGDYSIKEVGGGTGYILSDKEARFSIREDGEVVDLVGDEAIANQVKRGDLELVKADEDSQRRMAGVPFRITSVATGESHVLVTDENGYATTAASFNKHTHKTNYNDTAADGSYDAEAGVWFGLTKEGWTVDADDGLGALPYDVYDIEELPCKANEGRQLVKLAGWSITRDGYTVNVGTVDDPSAHISTSAADAVDGNKEIFEDFEAGIVDRVDYSGLIPGGAYRIDGRVVFADTGEPLNVGGHDVEASASFTAEAANGYVDMAYAFDATSLGGRDIVVTATLYDASGRVLAVHDALDNTEQTVRIAKPSIGTVATDEVTGGKEVTTDPEAAVRDTVSYKGLVPGKTYKLTGWLVKADGSELSRTTLEFVPDAADGSAVMDFDASALEAGEDVTVFEVLTREGREVARHTEQFSATQTVALVKPEIGTTARDGLDGDSALVADEEAVIVDVVEYWGLVADGREYTMHGTVYDKATGEPLADAAGNPVVASTAFAPDLPHGTVEVRFAFDASLLQEGQVLVCGESLERLGRELAVHFDLEDRGQTVEVAVPKIATEARDAYNLDKLVVADPRAEIVDTVAYEDLAGGEHTLFGILMDKGSGLPLTTSEGIDVEELEALCEELAGAMGMRETAEDEEAEPKEADSDDANIAEEGGSDGDPSQARLPFTPDFDAMEKLLEDNADLSGSLVTAEASFEPEAGAGSVDVSFDFDASRFIEAEKTTDVVVYQLLLKNGKVIAAECDIDAEGQTVTISPSGIGTTASDKSDGDSELLPSAMATVEDVVAYTGLREGESYTLKAILMNCSTGKPLSVGDRQVAAEKSFVPNAPDGTVSIDLAFDASGLKPEAKLVVFETLYKDGIEEPVAAHQDLEDEGQTVAIVEGPRGKVYDKTGSTIGWLLAGLAVCGAVGCGALAYGLRKCKGDREDDDQIE